MRRRPLWLIFAFLFVTVAAIGIGISSIAEMKSKGAYILDRTGEKWDVSQAVSIGFKPERFQYGIGRHAFKPLDDAYLQSGNTSIPRNLRVIGVAAGKDAQGYSVATLSRHETANMTLDSEPILVAY